MSSTWDDGQACMNGATHMFSMGDGKAVNLTGHVELEPSSKPIDVLVDTIIGFLEKSSSFTRTVGNEAFSLLSGFVEDTTIDLILAVRLCQCICTFRSMTIGSFVAIRTARSCRVYRESWRRDAQ